MFTLLGVDWTGFYLNPINATNQTFGCDGVSVWEHIAIYWVGPLSATVLSTRLHPHLVAQWTNYCRASTHHALMYSPSMTFDDLGQMETEETLTVDAESDIQGTEDVQDLNHNKSATVVNGAGGNKGLTRRRDRKTMH